MQTAAAVLSAVIETTFPLPGMPLKQELCRRRHRRSFV